MALILDTGPLYASLDRNDADYLACRRLIETSYEELVIPAPVLVEVDYWINARMHPGIMVSLLDDIISGAYRLEEPQTADYRRIRELWRTQARSLLVQGGARADAHSRRRRGETRSGGRDRGGQSRLTSGAARGYAWVVAGW